MNMHLWVPVHIHLTHLFSCLIDITLIDSVIDSHGDIQGDGIGENTNTNSSNSHLNALYECDFPTFLIWFSGDLNKLGPGLDPLSEGNYSKVYMRINIFMNIYIYTI
jgi:hypothetical protein